MSSDLRTWDETEPFLIEDRQEVPECPDTFVWNGRHYLVFSYGQVARYRVSDTPLGPWLKPRVEILDGGAARVIKTAAFTGNRRIATASLWPQGYAGYAVFRELIQNPDGTLGTSFVPEMIPQGGEPVTLQLLATVGGASGNGRSIRLDAQSERASAVLSPLPHNARIHLRVESSAEVLTLTLRTEDVDSPGIEIRILPGEQRVAVTGATQLSDVDGLDRPFDLDIILTERILDLSLSQQRTLVNWVGEAAGDRWVLSAEKGRAVCDVVEVRPLP